MIQEMLKLISCNVMKKLLRNTKVMEFLQFVYVTWDIYYHRTWKLGKNTLINIYRSLVGSVIDYNFFILPFVSSQNLNRLQSIQNKALRCILKLPFNQETGRHYSTESLNNLSGLGSISARLTELKKEYLKAALNKQNPLICPLIEEYLSSRSEIEKEGSSPSILTGVESIT